MLRWIPYAMVRIAAFFVGGIFLGICLPGFIPYRYALALSLILIPGYFVSFFILKQKSSLTLVSGFIGLMAIFLAGYINLINHTDSNSADHLSHFKGPIDFYSGRIASMPEERTNSRRIEVEIMSVKSGDAWVNVTGKSLLYIAKNPGLFDLQYGDRILIKAPLAEVPPPANPGEFNFRKFLSYKNISHQQFVRRDQIRLVERIDHPGLLFYSQQMRSWASSKIESFVSGSREQGIAKALVLGVTEGLDNELQGAYAASGAMHILSVSGLHVGIIYGIILILLMPLNSRPWSRWLVAILSLFCLWAYAFITGLSPSVLRAVTMFSFIVIARPVGRQTNIYNTLAASALLLLIYNPYLIMSVGFQLSYLAVIGIVYLQRPLYNLWEPSFWLWDKVWQVLCVSLAAQLATFVLGLYYFHQFPVYFLISNLIVIPLSSLVLLVGILLLVVGAIPVLASFVGLVLQFLIGLLNGSVFLIEGLPFSLIERVNITAAECWLLLALVISFVLLFELKKLQFGVVALLLVCLFSFLQWKRVFEEMDHGRFIVYQIPGHGAIEWIERGQSYFYADSALIADGDQVRFHIRPNRILSGVGKTLVNTADSRSLKAFSGFRFLLHHRITVLWIDQNHCDLPGNAVTDYLIIGKDAVRSLEGLRNKIKFKQMILDGSNSKAYAARLVKEAKSKNIAVHSVVSQGAFVVTL